MGYVRITCWNNFLKNVVKRSDAYLKLVLNFIRDKILDNLLPRRKQRQRKKAREIFDVYPLDCNLLFFFKSLSKKRELWCLPTTKLRYIIRKSSVISRFKFSFIFARFLTDYLTCETKVSDFYQEISIFII